MCVVVCKPVLLFSILPLVSSPNMSSTSDSESAVSDCSPPRPGQTMPGQFEPDIEQDDGFNPNDEDRTVGLTRMCFLCTTGLPYLIFLFAMLYALNRRMVFHNSSRNKMPANLPSPCLVNLPSLKPINMKWAYSHLFVLLLLIIFTRSYCTHQACIIPPLI